MGKYPVVAVQSLLRVWLFATPWTAAPQASLSFTISLSFLRLMSTESVMPSNHLTLCHPLLLLPSIFPSIKVFSNELILHIRHIPRSESESCSEMSNSLQPHGPYSPWNSPSQNTGMDSFCPLQGIYLPSPGNESRSLTLQADSLPAEPPGKPKNTGVGSLSLPQGIFLNQELNQGLLHCRWILYELIYQGSPYTQRKTIIGWFMSMYDKNHYNTVK